MDYPFDSNGQLIHDVCERARLERDPAYDGVFFICARTTRIYCRPICPVRQPRPENVWFAASAAAAEARGYRPCLRCRPESAPFSPAWRGTAATVDRALRIINEGYLATHTADDLASRIGVSTRHLRRLFQQHTDSTIRQAHNTHRLHEAKRLITDTEREFSDIAFAAGFGSVRRFNEVVRRSFGRTPGQLRSTRRRNQSTFKETG